MYKYVEQSHDNQDNHGNLAKKFKVQDLPLKIMYKTCKQHITAKIRDFTKYLVPLYKLVHTYED